MVMNRLGICAIYDPQGIVDDYVLFLLKELNKVVSRLIVVVNGYVTANSHEKLKSYAAEILTRENKGFDGGAYKDVFENYLTKEDVSNFDSVVLCNDTFYGPFYPFENVFSFMQPLDYDFWGLSRHAGGGKVLGIGMDIPPHLQGYFLVVNKKILSSDCFLPFFKNLSYPKTYQDAIEKFEIGFTSYFSKFGFKYGDYAQARCWKTVPNCVNYIRYADLLVKDYDFPILKKKALSLSNFLAHKNVLDYLKNSKRYDVQLILNNLKRLHSLRNDIFNLDQIDSFFKNHDKVYVWGNGEIGKNISAFLKSENYIVSGVITSDNFSDFAINSNDGIILALGRNACSEVLPLVKESFSEQQLLIPNYA